MSHRPSQSAMAALWADEATWEDEQLMKEAYPKLFKVRKHRDDV